MGDARHPFAEVDAQPDPSAWIAVLDRIRREPAYAAYKRRAAELLDPRRGGRYLEVGCGAGDDARALAERFGAAVVGADVSGAMVAEARRRGLAEVVAADAHALPFETASFDGAWADRTLQHLADPSRAVAELARVVRPGGTVVVVDPDYATLVVNVRDQALADRVLAFRAGVGNGTLAHQASRLLAEAGLREVVVEAAPVVIQDPAALDNALGLRDWASLAAAQDRLDTADVEAWQRALDEAAAGGWFLFSFELFLTAGRKPA